MRSVAPSAREIVEDDDFRYLFLDETVGDVRADQAGAAGDQDACVLKRHHDRTGSVARWMAAVTIAIPFGAQWIGPISSASTLTITAPAAPDGGTSQPIYFERLTSTASDGAVRGVGRFNFEAWMLSRVGFKVDRFGSSQVFTTRLVIDGICPFLLLIGVSGVGPRLAQTILSVATSYNIDLIVMTSEGKTGMKRWVLGSITERVLDATRLPLLIVRPPETEFHRAIAAVDFQCTAVLFSPHHRLRYPAARRRRSRQEGFFGDATPAATSLIRRLRRAYSVRSSADTCRRSGRCSR